ncbi:MAG: helix-turn-helix domain-containing protein [Clostridia bacterium]|nr:helix-turn-helix domain-containing protein [Clostridia bacterium]
MEKKTIGKFISALRKANGMTQKELGEKLFVSDKTVSRWECDECTPELSLIPSIAEIFGITTDELLRGERNYPDREATTSEDVASKQKAKSDKQFKLMLHSRKKKFTNLSFISIGLIIVGLIAAMICNLGFSEGLLGFCLASVFFVAATICQICFTVSFRLLIDEEAEHAEEIKKANTDMVFSSVKIFFVILLTFAFCLPIAVLTLEYFNSHYGLVLDSWSLFGTLFAAVAFLLAFCVYKIFVLKALISKEIVWLDEQAVSKANVDSRLLKKLCIIFTIGFAVIMIATYIVTTTVGETTFVEKQKFDNTDDFIEYIQGQYDEWYEEGYEPSYGDIIIRDPDMDSDFTYPTYPNQSWGNIDGKDYYYCAHLYESITILQHENGEWEIVVITEDAYKNGTAMYDILNAGLFSLHFINLAVCIVWYFVDTRKRKAV